MVHFKNRNFKINSFTHYNILSLLFCIIYNNSNNIVYKTINSYINLYSTSCCWSWTIFITFHSGYFYDNNAFVKIRNKINCNFLEFHSGNFILHTIPMIYIYYNPPNSITIYDSLIALFIIIIWVYISTLGTMDLSNIYVKFSDSAVKKLYITSVLSCLSSPFFITFIN